VQQQHKNEYQQNNTKHSDGLPEKKYFAGRRSCSEEIVCKCDFTYQWSGWDRICRSKDDYNL